MFLFFHRRSCFLSFAVSCLAIAVRSLLIGDKFLTGLWPDVSWYGAMAAEYLALIVTLMAFLFYIKEMFPGLLHRWGLRLYTCASAAFALLVLAGGGVFLTALIAEAYLHSRTVRLGMPGIDQPAMMVFIFANMIALAVRYARTERELSDMTELNRMKTEF